MDGSLNLPAGPLLATAVSLGGFLAAPQHTVMQRLSERFITPEAITVFDIQPFGNGWRYPVPGGGYRWKNADSNAADKYTWLDSKPDTANFYHTQDIGIAIHNAGGACWFVSGEADVWAMLSAGVGHVMSGYTESHVSQQLTSYLESLGVTLLYIAPDLDPTGERWARLVAQALWETSIELDARRLPASLGGKGDIGKAWVEHRRRQPFERWLLGLPRFAPEPGPRPEATKTQPTDLLPVPAGYRELVADVLEATDYQEDGFTDKNVSCPFHDDTRPSASLHHEKGLYCHTCGRWYSWNETGIKIGAGSLLSWRLSGHFCMSTELREGLIKAGSTSLSRMLDCFMLIGWDTGREFSRKDAVAACDGLLSYWTIRQATRELESYCGFFPPFSLQPVKSEKTRKKSRPRKIYRVPSLAVIGDKLQARPFHFDEMNPEKIRRAADYRAEVYAALPRRRPGQYARKTLTGRIGVTTRTGQEYDKRAGLKVTTNIERRMLSPSDIANLPNERPPDFYNIWLEDDGGRRYPPVKRVAEWVAARGKVYRVEQFANSYQAGQASQSQPELTE